jgi:hypothetical protein
VFRAYRVREDRLPTYDEFRRELARIRRVEGAAARRPEGGRGGDEDPAPELGPAELVALHYFAYLERDPGPGLEIRLARFEEDRDGEALTRGFLDSSEYRLRFGY